MNVVLTEAIALGHDCGHGPGGHASEEALSPFLAEGFDHAVWGTDVTAAPLNLCAETLDGIRNHSWSRPAPATPEGEVVALADRIAYCAHDLEDAVHAGIVSGDDLPPIVVERCGRWRGQQLDAFVKDVVTTTISAGYVSMSEPMGEVLEALRRYNYERIYLRGASIRQSAAVVDLLQSLVEYYLNNPADLPGGLDLEPGSPETVRPRGRLRQWHDRPFRLRSGPQAAFVVTRATAKGDWLVAEAGPGRALRTFVSLAVPYDDSR